MSRTTLKNLGFSLLVCAVVFGFLEGGFRLIKPGFVYRIKASGLFYRITFDRIGRRYFKDKYIDKMLNTKEVHLGQDGNSRWLMYMKERNSLGFRGPEFSKDKGGKLRIVCMGDSITWDGWYVDTLERELKVRYGEDRIEVFNCGLPGRPSLFGLETFRKEIIGLKPDLVVFAYAINDANLHQTERSRRKKALESRWLSSIDEGLDSLDVYAAIKSLVCGIQDSFFDPMNPGGCEEGDRFSLCRYKDNLESIIGSTKSEEICLVFLTSHSPFYYPALERYNEVMKAVAGANEVAVLDVREAFISAPISERERNLLARQADINFIHLFNRLWSYPEVNDKVFHPTYIFYMDFFHPNRMGHEVIGKRLAELIENEGLLEKRKNRPTRSSR